MKKRSVNLLVALLFCLILVGTTTGYLFFFQNNQTEPENKVTYALVTTSPQENSIAFDGCGTEFIQMYSVDVPGNLQDSLEALFNVTDYQIPNTTYSNSLYNSDIAVSITSEGDMTLVNLDGDLISAGTCDDPRVINQITKTIEANLPDDTEYKILLNGSEQNWRCWNDMSGTCS